MKNTVVYYVVKNLYTGLFYTGENWIIPKDRLDVLMCAYADTEKEALEDFEEYTSDIENKSDLVITTITVETNIIF